MFDIIQLAYETKYLINLSPHHALCPNCRESTPNSATTSNTRPQKLTTTPGSLLVSLAEAHQGGEGGGRGILHHMILMM
jgi:hypothetical protein